MSVPHGGGRFSIKKECTAVVTPLDMVDYKIYFSPMLYHTSCRMNRRTLLYISCHLVKITMCTPVLQTFTLLSRTNSRHIDIKHVYHLRLYVFSVHFSAQHACLRTCHVNRRVNS